MKAFRQILFAIMCVVASGGASGQIIVDNVKRDKVNADSIRRAFDRGPYFSLYKDNYFIFGTSIGPKPTKANSNIKFQISLQMKLTKSVLPFHSYLYLFYTQKSIWNVLEESMPMRDLNFNPGIGLARPFFSSEDGRYMGKMMLVLEHESNGRDGLESRSWNRVVLGGNILLDKYVMVNAKIWCPIVDGENNRDLLKYRGIYSCGMQVMSADRRLAGAVQLTKRLVRNLFAFNVQVDLKYRLFPNDNGYLYMQYYNGYGENLLDYNQFRSQLRVGLCFTPHFFSDY